MHKTIEVEFWPYVALWGFAAFGVFCLACLLFDYFENRRKSSRRKLVDEIVRCMRDEGCQ